MYSLLSNEEVRAALQAVRMLAGLVLGGLVLVVVLGAAGVAVRLLRPVDGHMGPIVLAGTVGFLLLAGAIVVLEVSGRRAGRAQTLERAVLAYRGGCAVGGGLNFLGGVVTVIVIFANGVSGGLWVPAVLVLALNSLGLVLAVPRLKHIRRLHYSPTLPVTRV
ncbi:MAG: hypothetical protein AMJ81_07330 [Phycisphaerae bacterium SM23_33]|nr:MAG: hypothetical protein AMJ81_07330 [Phycisphaerae bacterium SM23_33]